MVVPFFVGVLVITVLDQIAKFFTVAYLKDLGTIPIIENSIKKQFSNLIFLVNTFFIMLRF